jgi:hypothetical protein
VEDDSYEPVGPHLWFDELNEGKYRLQTWFGSTVVTDEKYNTIRSWLFDISNNYRYHDYLSAKFNSYTGMNLGTGAKDYRHASLMQWATGKVLGRGAVRSFMDPQSFNSEVRAADGTKVGRWEYNNGGNNVDYTEFGVWMQRRKGVTNSMTLAQAEALIRFLGDQDDVTKFWSLYGGPAKLADNVNVPNTGVSVAIVKEYVEYIKQTFVIADFNEIDSETSRAKLSGAGPSGAERGGAERGGAERGGAERSGAGWSGAGRSRAGRSAPSGA